MLASLSSHEKNRDCFFAFGVTQTSDSAEVVFTVKNEPFAPIALSNASIAPASVDNCQAKHTMLVRTTGSRAVHFCGVILSLSILTALSFECFSPIMDSRIIGGELA